MTLMWFRGRIPHLTPTQFSGTLTFNCQQLRELQHSPGVTSLVFQQASTYVRNTVLLSIIPYSLSTNLGLHCVTVCVCVLHHVEVYGIDVACTILTTFNNMHH